jgi:hypothetical protein
LTTPKQFVDTFLANYQTVKINDYSAEDTSRIYKIIELFKQPYMVFDEIDTEQAVSFSILILYWRCGPIKISFTLFFVNDDNPKIKSLLFCSIRQKYLHWSTKTKGSAGYSNGSIYSKSNFDICDLVFDFESFKKDIAKIVNFANKFKTWYFDLCLSFGVSDCKLLVQKIMFGSDRDNIELTVLPIIKNRFSIKFNGNSISECKSVDIENENV